MRRINALAMLTFKEGIRERALYGITIVALLMLVATIIVIGLFGHGVGKVLVDLNLSTIAFSGIILVFFVNINLMAKDIDKRTVYCVLSKPISRTEYIIGKYLGLGMLIVVCLTFLFCFSTGIVLIAKQLHAEYFLREFSWACYFQAFFYELMMFLLMNAIVIFFSSITTSSFLTLIFSVATYITGHTIEEVIHFFKQGGIEGHEPSVFYSTFMNIIQYILPNLSVFDIKTFASHGKLLSLSHTVAVSAYCFIYITLLLFFASLIFSRRELN